MEVLKFLVLPLSHLSYLRCPQTVFPHPIASSNSFLTIYSFSIVVPRSYQGTRKGTMASSFSCSSAEGATTPRSPKDPAHFPSERLETTLPKEHSEAFGSMVDTNGRLFHVPDFTIKQIRDAIPVECYERSACGFGYVSRDLFTILTDFYLFNTFVTPSTIPSYSLHLALWSLYGFLNGLFAMGLWVPAHECGHQSFSTSKLLNDTVYVHSRSCLLLIFIWAKKIPVGSYFTLPCLSHIFLGKSLTGNITKPRTTWNETWSTYHEHEQVSQNTSASRSSISPR